MLPAGGASPARCAQRKNAHALPVRSSPLTTERSLRSALETLHAALDVAPAVADRPKHSAPFARKPVFQELEARLLLSADLNPAAQDTLLATPALQGAEFRALADATAPTVVTSAQVTPIQRAHELVFVDTQTPEYEQLVEAMRAAAQANGIRLEFVLIDAERDGIRRITDTLAQKSDLDAIHVVSHAADGAVQLGSTQLDFETLVKRAAAIKKWGDALTESGDILFYGCDLAATSQGQSLMQAVARLTGADVAASEDPTGAASKGGDWELEFKTGAIEAAVAADAAAQAQWNGLLVRGVSVGAGGTTTEAGGTHVVSVVLTGLAGEAPTSNVVIPISVTDTTEGTVSTTTLTFTPGNWNVAQNVTITGRDDSQTDGDVGYTFVTGALSSTDLAWSGNDPADRAMTNADDDRVQSNAVALYTFEEGAGATLNDVAGANLALTVTGTGAWSWQAGALAVTTNSDANYVIAQSAAGTNEVYTRIVAAQQFTVEAWVENAAGLQQDPNAPHRLATLSADPSNRNFSLMMTDADEAGFGVASGYVARVRGGAGDLNGSVNPVNTPAGSATTALQHVVLTVNPAGDRTVYIDGVAQGTVNAGAVNFASWANNYRLALFNELTYTVAANNRGWIGTMHLAAVYDRALTGAEVQRNFAAGADIHTLVVDTASDVNDGDVSSIEALLNDRGSDGFISLREAILATNATANAGTPDRILFNIAGAGPHTISVGSALPTISDAVIIDGWSEPDFAGSPVIELRPTVAGAEMDGLTITAGGSTVRGLIINRFGTDTPDPDATGAALVLAGGGGNTIVGNWIGLGIDGTTDRGNEFGIYVNGSANNVIGGTTAAERNVIGGNDDEGIRIEGAAATGNRVIGNYIGTDVGGTLDRGASSDGILIWTGADNNTVGGTAAGEGNLIAFNDYGVSVADNGTDGNAILGNRIHSSAVLGIELDPAAGVDINDPDDIDNGPNQNQNYPVLASAVTNGSTVRIAGSLDGPVSSYFRIELFANATNDREGQRYLGYVNVATGGTSTDATFDVTLQAAVAVNEYVTAVATRANATYTTYFDSSEFSATRLVTLAAGSEISGTLWEDVDGDADVSLGDGTQRIAGATVHLWADVFGAPTYLTTATTDANGNYSFIGLADNTYGVVVDSKTIAPSAGFNSGFGQANVWAEQTYATAGAAYWDGAAIAYLAGAGALYGGTNLPAGGLSDDASVPANFEHVTRVDTLGGAYAGVDFGFSFSAVTSARGDNADDDATRAGVQQQGTLRQFILNANAIVGTQTSAFAIAGAGVQTINLATALPDITNTVVLDGWSEGVFQGTPGYSGPPRIELNGSGTANYGLSLAAGSDASTVRGFVINRFALDGIGLFSAGNLVQGNYIGTDSTGTVTAGFGNGDDGIDFDIGASGNTIGGTGAGERNVISGNAGDGITIDGAGVDNNVVIGNYIGTDVTGTLDRGNGQNGVHIRDNAAGNTVGGTTAAARNVISGNDQNGVLVLGTAGTGNVVRGNYVGTDVTGTLGRGNAQDGVHVAGATNTIGGTGANEGNLVSGNDDDGIEINGGNGNVVQGNYVGTNAAGTAAVRNATDGIRVESASNNLIGGTAAGARNVVSGNFSGTGIYVGVFSVGNRVEGNFVGTNATGAAGVGNNVGIFVENTHGNSVGGTAAGAGNVISGNVQHGMRITGTDALGNLVQGNRIGTDAAGTGALGNGNLGILVSNDNNTIGGTAAGTGNTIANSGSAGVAISAGTGNVIQGNAIYGNGGLGIDLGAAGIAPNDAGDSDPGANNLQNFPLLASATLSGGNLTIAGTLNGTASRTFRIEFFASAVPTPGADASGNGEGQRYLGFLNVVTDGAGNVAFTSAPFAGVLAGEIISATATDLTTRDTSEFAANATAVAAGSISGTIYNDVDGDADVAEGGTLAFAGATVRLYDAGGVLQATTSTDAAGAYAFTGLASGTYYVAVDSRTLDAGVGAYLGPATLDDVWAEQTWGDDSTTAPLVLAARYGGRNAGVSDDAAAFATSEHLAQVGVAGAAVGGVDFGFSFGAIVNTRGDTTDDDLANARMQQGTLRQFILNSNALAGEQTSEFSIGATGSTQSIAPAAVLPTITDAVTLNAWTQAAPGYNGVPLIELRGDSAGAGADGFVLAANDSEIRGFVINRFDLAGIWIGGTGNLVAGNYLGTDAAGAAALGNGTDGVVMAGPVAGGSAASNTIGGIGAGDRNVISGNGDDGISMDESDGNVVLGNYVGLNAAGTAVIGNAGDGVAIQFVSVGNTVGGTTAAHRNVIAGNGAGAGGSANVIIRSAGSTGNVVLGNYIGTDFSGTTALASPKDGVLISEDARNNTVGGTAAGSGNVIGGHTGNGVHLTGDSDNNRLHRNWIGTNAGGADLGNARNGVWVEGGALAGSSPTTIRIGGIGAGEPNTIAFNDGDGVLVSGAGTANVLITANSIHSNGELGIDLVGGLEGASGVTPNDPVGTWGPTDHDPDTGPNNLQNHPSLSGAVWDGATLWVSGVLESTGGLDYRIHVYASAASDGSGYGEGERYLGRFDVVNINGQVLFNNRPVVPLAAVAAGDWITLTATAITGPNPSTSEFSFAAQATGSHAISGRISHDVNGDSSLAGDSGLGVVTVHLFRDGGDGLADGADDAWVATTATDAAGDYSFTGLTDDTYWVVVDSKTLSGNPALWAEQTRGAAGALQGAGFLAGAGALYGGRNATVSDNASNLPSDLDTAEHVTRVIVAGADVANVDSAFSFNVVVNVRGDGADDDEPVTPGTARHSQGTLDQFILNANNFAGGNAMRFVPAVAANRTSGSDSWWQIGVTSLLPQIAGAPGAGTVIDGTAYSSADGVTVLDTNAGFIGAGGTVGTGADGVAGNGDDLPLAQVARPELEIRRTAAGALVAGLDVNAANVTIADLSIWAFGNGAGQNADIIVRDVAGAFIQGNVIGTGAHDFTDPGAGARGQGFGVWVRDGNTGRVQGNLVGFHNWGGVLLEGPGNSPDDWQILGNEIRSNGWGNPVFDGIGLSNVGGTTTVQGNLVTGNRSSGIDLSTATGTLTIDGNTISGNALAAGAEQFGLAIRGGTATTTIGHNVVTANTGTGVLVSGTASAEITQNSIAANGGAPGLGIDLSGVAAVGDGVTANDANDADGGPNARQNFPVLTGGSYGAGTLTVNGTLHSNPSTANYRIELYASSAADPGGHGEGARYLGAVTGVGTDAAGNATFTFAQALVLNPGEVITATATNTVTGRTSEFSAALYSVTGTVYEDVNGNGAVLDDGVGRAGVDVRLYLDANQNGNPDAGDGAAVATATTNGSGAYWLFAPGVSASLLNGQSFVVVDSRDIAPAAGTIAGGADDVWADETYAYASALGADSVQAVSYNGAYQFQTAAGAFYGGLIANRSDDGGLSLNAGAAPAAEHIQRLTIGAGSAGLSGVDSGFSFSAVTNNRGDNADDSAGFDRMQQGSLRQFILNSNAINGVQASDFSIGGGGAQTIAVTGAVLPTITDAVVLDATTQAGYAGTPLIELNGAGLGAGSGLTLGGAASSGSTVAGFVVNRFGSGIAIRLLGSSNNVVAGNYLGTDAAGTAAQGNQVGVFVQNGAGNTIGGTAAADRNVISGNTVDGIQITGASAANNVVLGNYIGVDATGLADLGNANQGVAIFGGADANTVGGTAGGSRNVISGNNNFGIGISGAGTSGNIVQGNYIGLGVDGVTVVGNSSNGVDIIAGATGTTVGGAAAAARNVISGNAARGVNIDGGSAHLIAANFIGTDATGTLDRGNGDTGLFVANATGVTIGGAAAGERNVISGNAQEGIVLANADGATVRDNYLGTNAAGTAALGNDWEGIQLANGASGVTIRDNLISGNGRAGIRADHAGTSAVVRGNRIGTDATGTIALGNGAGNEEGGIWIGNGADGFTIGGTGAGEGNLIAHNFGAGVRMTGVTGGLVQGNTIASNVDPTPVPPVDNGAGVHLDGSSGVTVGGTAPGSRNVISANQYSGVFVGYNSSGNWVAGNYLGTDATGTVAQGNVHSGVLLYWNADNNTIGGTSAAAGNLISGNGVGVWIEASSDNNVVSANCIGVDSTGAADLGNASAGVNVNLNSQGNRIGGTLAGERNVIAGNGAMGVRITAGSDGTRVEGNYIGTNAAGIAAIRNDGGGVSIGNSAGATVGGAAAGAGNVISGHSTQAGIEVWGASPGAVIQGNRIGTDMTGTVALGNYHGVSLGATNATVGGTGANEGNVIAHSTYSGVDIGGTGNSVLSNSIHSNGALGINLVGGPEDAFGVTANDAGTGDGDAGANGLQNHPVLTTASLSGGNITLAGTLDSAVGGSFRLEFYASTAADPSGHGEGERYLGFLDVTDGGMNDADGFANGVVVFSTTFVPAAAVAGGDAVSATATNTATGETSEFAANRVANTAPVNTVPATATVNEDTAFAFTGANLVSVADAQNNVVQVVLTVANGTLSAAGPGTVAGSGTASVTITGTQANINASLATLVYQGTPNYYGPDTLTVVSTDADGMSDNDACAITVNAVNDAPVNGVPGPQAVNEDATLVFSTGNGNRVSIADVDAGASLVDVALTVTNGTLTLAGTAGLAFVAGADGTATMTVRGTIADINTAMDGMTYAPVLNYNGPATLSILTDDRGFTGAPGPLSDSDVVNITVNAVNDAPVNGVPGPQAVNEDATLVFSTGNGNRVSIADVDAGASLVDVALTVTNGTLTLAGTAGLAFVAGADGTATMTVRGTIADINTAIDGMTYAPTLNYNGPATLSIVTDDRGFTGAPGPLSDSDVVNITVNALNDAPVNSVPAAQATAEDTALVFSTANGNRVSIADVDAGAALVDVSLTVTNGTLTLAGTAGLAFVAGADGTATMTVRGTIADINTAMDGMTYAPALNFNGAATLSILNDDRGNTGAGGALTDADVVNIAVAAANDAPVNTVPGAQATNEDTALVFSAGTGNLVAIADADAGVAVVQVQLTVTNGTLTLAGTAGLAFMAGADGTATMTIQGTVAALNAALDGMTYAPAADFNGPATLAVTTDDLGNTGAGGALTDTDVVNITVNAINDAPVNTVPGAQAGSEDVPLALAGVAVNDVDGGPVEVALGVANGTLNVSLAGGATVTAGANGAAALTLGGTQAQVNAALATLAYTGAANWSGADTLTMTTTDLGNFGAGGALGDLDPIALTINPVNDAPALGANAFTINEGATLALGGANLSATDIDDAAAGLVFSVGAVTNGYFQLASAPGAPITSFTQAQVQSGQVQFVHSGGVPSFTIAVSDGAAAAGPVAANITFNGGGGTPTPPPGGGGGGGASVTPTVTPPAAAPAAPVVPPGLGTNLVGEFIRGVGGGGGDAGDTTVFAEAAAVLPTVQSASQAQRAAGAETPAPQARIQGDFIDTTPLRAEIEVEPARAEMQVLPTRHGLDLAEDDPERQRIEIVMNSVRITGMALSVGAIWWAARAAGLVASLLASSPAWRHVDPLPVLGRDEDEEEGVWDEDAAEEQERRDEEHRASWVLGDSKLPS